MRVVVLMSTYNGERFIGEQMNSILQQLPPDGLLMVRDDGSSDSTADQVDAFGDARVHLVRGDNIGFAPSFLTLLAAVLPDAEMVMFSDQDDVWLPDKIERAWKHLEPLAAGPALYGSTQMLADEALRPLRVTPTWPRGPSFQSALAENIITGCTAAINQPALAMLQSAGVPEGVRFHDWWLYLVVSAFGTVVFDPEPSVLYRQHGKNQIGHGVGWWGRQRQMAQFLLKHDWVGILLGQVAAFQRHFGGRLDTQRNALVQRHFLIVDLQAQPSWRLVLSARRWCQGTFQEIMFRILLALHRLRLWPTRRRRLEASASR